MRLPWDVTYTLTAKGVKNAPWVITFDRLPMGWTYTVTEKTVEGFEAPTYIGGTYAAAGGAITNRAKPVEAALRLNKRLVDLDDPTKSANNKWPDSNFSFTMAFKDYKDAGGTAQTTTTEGNAVKLGGDTIMELPSSTETTALLGNPSATFDSVKFYRAGEYTFTIRENVPAGTHDTVNGPTDDDGVVYDNATHTARVVVSESGGVLTAAEPRYDGNSLGLNVTNRAKAATPCELTVTKTLTGDMADMARTFTFTLTVTNPKAEGEVYTVVIDGASASIASGGTFVLGHGQHAKITGLYVEETVTVSEAKGAYSVAWTLDNVSKGTDSAVTWELADAQHTLAATNTLTAPVETGLALDFWPYVTLLLLLGAAGWLARKRRWERGLGR